jgi:hypothetical protein
LKSGIVEILHRLAVKFSFNLIINGHQDEESAVEDLAWEAQMNCRADAYATDYVENWSASFIPASKVSVSIAVVTITRNVERP